VTPQSRANQTLEYPDSSAATREQITLLRVESPLPPRQARAGFLLECVSDSSIKQAGDQCISLSELIGAREN
jgi:hypothetical protein